MRRSATTARHSKSGASYTSRHLRAQRAFLHIFALSRTAVGGGLRVGSDQVAKEGVMKPSLASALLAVLLSTTVLYPQGVGSSGNIKGTVTDPSSAVMPRAMVTVADIATGSQRKVMTDSAGQ